MPNSPSKISPFKIIAVLGLGVILMLGLASCGKRGDPYRPSEISNNSSS